MLLTAGIAVLVLGCDTSNTYAAGKSIVTGIPAKTVTIKKKKTKTIKLSKKGCKVIVSAKGKKLLSARIKKNKLYLKGIKNGKTKITVKSGKKKMVLSVIVGTPVKKIEIKNTTKSVGVGKTMKLNVNVLPRNASNKKIIYKSENNSIAKVSSKGIVTGVKSGKTNIIATAEDGSGIVKKYEVEVVNSVQTDETKKSIIKSVEFVNDCEYLKIVFNEKFEWDTKKIKISKMHKNNKDKNKWSECSGNMLTYKEDDYTYYINCMYYNYYYKFEVEGYEPYIFIDEFPKGAAIYYRQSSSGMVAVTPIDDKIFYSIDEDNNYTEKHYTIENNMGVGCCELSWDKVPKGLKYSVSFVNGQQDLLIEGCPEEVGRTHTVFTAVDEEGTTRTYDLEIITYDKNTIICDDVEIDAVKTEDRVLCSDYKINVWGGTSASPYVYTGENWNESRYRYEVLSGKSEGINLLFCYLEDSYSRNKSLDINFVNPKKDRYEFKVKVYDEVNPDVYAIMNVVVNVKESVRVGFKVSNKLGLLEGPRDDAISNSFRISIYDENFEPLKTVGDNLDPEIDKTGYTGICYLEPGTYYLAYKQSCYGSVGMLKKIVITEATDIELTSDEYRITPVITDEKLLNCTTAEYTWYVDEFYAERNQYCGYDDYIIVRNPKGTLIGIGSTDEGETFRLILKYDCTTGESEFEAEVIWD